MANTSNSDKWYFTKEQLENTPSRKCGFDAHKELSYRQQAANFIQDMGQRLKVSQLCINTAIVYMHRFYVFHSFTHFPWYQMAAASLFLAAKVEEQPRKLEYVIRVANMCRNIKDVNIDVNSEKYIAQSQDLVFNENVLLQTLGFDVAIDHPHTHVVRCCHLVRASKDLAQTSYFMASNSLHLTTMCIQYKPTVVACFCILVACKWSNWEIPLSNEKKEWFKYVDPTVTAELLQQLTEEFLVIFEACPSRLKEKIMAIADNVAHLPSNHISSHPDVEFKKIVKDDGKGQHQHRSHENKIGPEGDLHKHRPSRPYDAGSSSQQQRERDRNHDRERLAAQQKAFSGNSQSNKGSHLHHRPPLDQKMKPHSRPPSMGSSSGSASNSSGSYISGNRVEPRDILREASKDSPFGLANKDFRDPSREHGKEPSAVRSGDLQKRDYLLKPNVQTELNSANNHPDNRYSFNVDRQRVDANGRSKVDPSKLPSVNKHELIRKSEEIKPYLKLETENIKKHLSASTQDKNSTYINKPIPSTSQKTKSPFDGDPSKSVLKPNVIQSGVPPKPQPLNGNASDNMCMNRNPLDTQIQVKSEPVEIKEEPVTLAIIKRPSLFSPEQTPPHHKEMKLEKLSPIHDKKPDTPITPAFSPFSSPIAIMRDRNLSTSSSEPELRPVMKKIDQVEGFENIMRDSTIGINKMNQPEMTSLNLQIKQEVKIQGKESVDNMKPQETQAITNLERGPIVNGLETTPSIISNLLKEVPALPHLTSGTTAMNINGSENTAQAEVKLEKEHHHHKSKKKNKEKHKHKDKDRSKEDKEKKKKHKDKERDRHKHKDKHQDVPEITPVPAEPIKLKIQKDRIQPISESPVPCTGLKIKIPKDKIKTESITELTQQSLAPPPQPTIGIKLKIPKEKLNNCISLEPNSKKRERDKSSPSESQPTKIPKISHKDSKQNGRHTYNKVAHSGDGETSLHRLAESKYTHKSSSS